MTIKLLTLVHGYYSSHTVRPLEIAKALRETGEYNITFSGEGEWMKLVEEAGFKWVRTELFPKRKILDLIEDHLVPRIFDNKDAERFYKIEEKLLKEQKPDIILRDHFRELAGIASKTQEKPIFDVFIQKANCCPYYRMDFRPKHFPWIIDKIVPKKLMQAIGPTLLEKPLRKWLFKPLYNQVKKHNLLINKNVPEGYEANLVFLPDEPAFFPFKNLRSNCKHLGTLLFEDLTPEPEWLDDFANNKRKKIVITNGTSGEQEKHELFKEAFKDNSYAVALQTPDENVQGNFYGKNMFNLQKTLPHADLFIHHGGTGSNYQGLKMGVPMLALPWHFEQQINGAQLEKTGAGLSFYPFDINPKSVREKTDMMIRDKRFKENAVAFSEKMEKEDPRDLSVKYIREWYKEFKLKNRL